MVSSEQKDTSLTVTLLLLNIMFIVSVGPLSIHLFLYTFLFEISNENEWAMFYFILELLNIVAGLNASINFVLYFLCGSKFRAEVKALLCCKNSQNQTGTLWTTIQCRCFWKEATTPNSCLSAVSVRDIFSRMDIRICKRQSPSKKMMDDTK